MLDAQLRHTMAGLKSRRERLLIWLGGFDQSFVLYTKLETVQSRACETNLELREAIQIKVDEVSSYMQACESKMSTLEEECKIAYAQYHPVLIRVLEIAGAGIGDTPGDGNGGEQLPAYAPRS